MPVEVVVVALVLFVVMFMLLANKYRHLRMLRQQLGEMLSGCDEKRTQWKNPWAERIRSSHQHAPTENTQKAIIALAVLDASQANASMDWSYPPATDTLLKHEWAFEEAVERLIDSDWKDDELLPQAWEQSQKMWDSQRQLMNAYSETLKKEQSDVFARVLEHIIYVPYPTVWMERKSFAIAKMRLEQALDQYN